jgi:hypothetical protein
MAEVPVPQQTKIKFVNLSVLKNFIKEFSKNFKIGKFLFSNFEIF